MRACRLILFCLALVLLFPSCEKKAEEPVTQQVEMRKIEPIATKANSVEELEKPENLAQKFSYVYGYQQAQALLSSYALDEKFIAKGVLDGASGQAFFTEEEMQAIMSEYIAFLQTERVAEIAKIQSENLKKAEDFLNINAQRKAVVTTDSGLQYEILREGTGKTPTASSIVNVQYKLTLLSGEVVDSSYSRGTSSRLDLNAYLVTGFKEAVMLLKEGGKLRAWLHPALGYGAYGSAYVQPNELLIFDIELLSIE